MNYDTIIIGFGKAGKTLAGYLAKKGEQVALIEKSAQMYGGTCINVGCIPSKSLVTSAAQAALYKNDNFEQKALRYKQAIEEKRRLTSFLREKNYTKLNQLENITIYNGTAEFLDQKSIKINFPDNKHTTLTADKIFINTGGTPVLPNISGIKDNPYIYTSETLMNEDKLPAKLILIGAGYIGMEFASLYANFGSEVTIIQDSDVFLPREDRDVADEIRSIQEQNGVTFELGAKNLQIENNTVSYEINGSFKTITGDAILLATGRKPNIAELHLEKAQIELTPQQAIKVDNLLRTNVDKIWALGDVNGGPQFTFISLDDFRIIKSQLENTNYTKEQRLAFAYSVFMSTPLARIGITETQAQQQNLPYRVVKLPTTAIPKAQVLRQTQGFLKAIINTETNKILGVALLCPEAHELINTVKLAMDLNLDYTYLRDTIYTHPTMTESFNDLFSL